jgi:signal transduction histidine kinase
MLLDRNILAKKQIEILESCVDCCQDLRELVEGLLDIHKMEEGKMEIAMEATNLAEVIEEIMDQFLLKAEEKQVSLSFHGSDRTDLIPADRRLVKRVIANLLNNAIRHTSSGGAIEITAKPIQDNGNFHISVKDSGNGLAPEYHHKVFDKFEQVKLKKARVAVGASGLGLAFCKLAVEAHGGKIWVESDGEGKGANFQFTLPVKC